MVKPQINNLIKNHQLLFFNQPISVPPSSIFERLGPSKTKAVSQPASSTVNESTLNLSTSIKNQSYKGVLKTFTVRREIKNPGKT